MASARENSIAKAQINDAVTDAERFFARHGAMVASDEWEPVVRVLMDALRRSHPISFADIPDNIEAYRRGKEALGEDVTPHESECMRTPTNSTLIGAARAVVASYDFGGIQSLTLPNRIDDLRGALNDRPFCICPPQCVHASCPVHGYLLVGISNKTGGRG